MPLRNHIIQRIQKKGVKDVNLANADIWDDDLPDLIKLLNQHKDIYILNLSLNNMSDEGIRKLVELTHITSLNLSFEPHFSNETAMFLVRHAQFTELDFSRNNQINDIAGNQMLLEATQIVLKLERTSISPELKSKIDARIEENMSGYVETLKKNKADKANKSKSGIDFFAEKKEEFKDPAQAITSSITLPIDEIKESKETSVTGSKKTYRPGGN